MDGLTENELFFFADDTILFKAHPHNSPEAEVSLQRDLDRIKQFGDIWAITFNPAKTVQQTFTNKPNLQPPSLVFGNVKIPLVSTHKHLGLNISSDLRFHVHVREIIKKANTALGPLYPVAKYIPRQILLNIYTTYIRPIFDYSDVVYNGHITVTDSLSLEKIQNRAARIITGAYRSTSTKALLEDLGLTTLQNRRDINSLIMFRKIKQLAPHYLQDISPSTRRETTSRQLRDASNITLPPNRLSSLKNSFFPRTIRRWNNLNEDIRTMQSLRSFSQAVALMHDLKKPPPYYSFGRKLPNVLHTRLRLRMSGLNSHLFMIHSLETKSPNCSCSQTVETITHYLFFCPHYNSIRIELETSLQNLIVNYAHLNLEQKLDTLLYGKGLDKSAGPAVAAAVQKYIWHSGRFAN